MDLPAVGDAEDSIMTIVDNVTKDGALDPLQEDYSNRRGCTFILATCGEIAWSPSGNPPQLGSPVCR